uniref:Uncharacterized protein n=1 Tax=Tetradesmus obliquus TaxID=3088 RepID=A0A383WHS6_TETOB|eukprot:jgi/Sobl393_1/19583/SZX77037.1
MDFQTSIGVDGNRLSALLARLSSLQQLRLSPAVYGVSIPGSCLAGVARLGQLTELVLGGSWQAADQPLQQLLQQPLPLRLLKLRLWRLPVINLAALTRLEEF